MNYCKLVAVSADPPLVCGAYRYGLGASFPFLSDTGSALIDRLGIRDRFESEYPGVAVPHTFVLDWEMRVHRVYNGWYFVGRPTVEELRHDLRELMSRREAWDYDRWEAPERLAAFPPAEAWLEGAPERPGAGAARRRGRVRQFAVDDGYGLIDADDGAEVFLHFSGIPGLGYRTVPPGAHVDFATVTGPTGREMAVDVQVLDAPGEPPGSAYNQKMSGLNR